MGRNKRSKLYSPNGRFIWLNGNQRRSSEYARSLGWIFFQTQGHFLCPMRDLGAFSLNPLDSFFSPCCRKFGHIELRQFNRFYWWTMPRVNVISYTLSILPVLTHHEDGNRALDTAILEYSRTWRRIPKQTQRFCSKYFYPATPIGIPVQASSKRPATAVTQQPPKAQQWNWRKTTIYPVTNHTGHWAAMKQQHEPLWREKRWQI